MAKEKGQTMPATPEPISWGPASARNALKEWFTVNFSEMGFTTAILLEFPHLGSACSQKCALAPEYHIFGRQHHMLALWLAPCTHTLPFPKLDTYPFQSAAPSKLILFHSTAIVGEIGVCGEDEYAARLLPGSRQPLHGGGASRLTFISLGCSLLMLDILRPIDAERPPWRS